MKKNLLGLFAVVLALVFTAFTSTKFVDVYLVYDDSGDQADIESYEQLSFAAPISGTNELLAWIKVADNNNEVLDEEFDPIFAELDETPNGSLDDEDEISGVLEKKPD